MKRSGSGVACGQVASLIPPTVSRRETPQNPSPRTPPSCRWPLHLGPQNRFKKSSKSKLLSTSFFHRFGNSKMAPKSTKNHSQEASKTLLEPTSCCKLFLLSFWLLFAPPGTSKMMVFLKGIIRFSKIQPSLKRPQKSPKMTPKWSQHGLPDAPGELKMRLQILACFWVNI